MKNLVILILSILLLPAVPLPCAGGQQIVLTDTVQLELARQLFKEKAFSSAAHEFVRFYHLFPGSDTTEEAGYMAGLSFFHAGMFQDAQRELERIAADFSGDTGFAQEAMFKLSELHAARKDPGQAILTLKNLLTLTEDDGTRDRACFILAWLLIDNAELLKAQSQSKMDPTAQAASYIRQISVQGREKYRMDDQILADLDGINEVKEKSPAVAGIAAVVPGGGFLYTERYRDSLVTFLLNSALILASYQSFDNDQEFLGGLLAFVEIGFYSGNIYGSISSAHKYNKNVREEYLRKLKTDYAQALGRISVRPRVNKNEAALLISYPF